MNNSKYNISKGKELYQQITMVYPDFAQQRSEDDFLNKLQGEDYAKNVYSVFKDDTFLGAKDENSFLNSLGFQSSVSKPKEEVQSFFGVNATDVSRHPDDLALTDQYPAEEYEPVKSANKDPEASYTNKANEISLGMVTNIPGKSLEDRIQKQINILGESAVMDAAKADALYADIDAHLAQYKKENGEFLKEYNQKNRLDNSEDRMVYSEQWAGPQNWIFGRQKKEDKAWVDANSAKYQEIQRNIKAIERQKELVSTYKQLANVDRSIAQGEQLSSMVSDGDISQETMDLLRSNANQTVKDEHIRRMVGNGEMDKDTANKISNMGDLTNKATMMQGLFKTGSVKDIATLGMNEISRNFDIVDIYNKMQKGIPVTDDERNVALLYGKLSQVQNKDRGFWFDFGQMMQQSLLFAAEMALTGGVEAAGKQLGKKGVKALIEEVGEQGMKKVIGQVAKNSLDVVKKSAVKQAKLTPLTFSTYANFSDRVTGETMNAFNEGKELSFGDYAKQLYLSYADTFAERFSESFGNVIEDMPMWTIISKGKATKELNNAFLRTLSRISDSKGFKATSEFLESVGIQSAPVEMLSELSGTLTNYVLQIPVEGFDNDALKEITPEFFLQVGLQSVIMGGMGTLGKYTVGAMASAVEDKKAQNEFDKALKRTELVSFSNDALNQLKGELLTSMENGNYITTESEQDTRSVGTILSEINNLVGESGNTDQDRFALSLLDNAVRHGAFRYGQMQSIKSYVEDKIGEYENADGNVYEVADTQGNTYYMLDSTDDAVIVIDRNTGEKSVKRKDYFNEGSIKQTDGTDFALQNFMLNIDRWNTEEQQSATNHPTMDNPAVNPVASHISMYGQNIPVERYDETTGMYYVLDSDGNEVKIDPNDTNVELIYDTTEQQANLNEEIIAKTEETAEQNNVDNADINTDEQNQEENPEQVGQQEEIEYDNEGNPVWLSASVERGKQEIDSAFEGDEAKAFVEDKVKEAKKALKKLENKKPKATNIRDRKAEIEQIKADKETAQKALDYWNSMSELYNPTMEQELVPEQPVEEPVAIQKTASDSVLPEGVQPYTVGENIKNKYNDAPKAYGAEDTYTDADGNTYKGRWVVVEADAVTPSHEPNTLQTSEGFPLTDKGRNVNDNDYSTKRGIVETMASDYDSRALDEPVLVSNGVVVSGNNRTIGRQLAAQKGTDTKYTEALPKKAEMRGVSAEELGKFKNPSLVFELTEPIEYTTENFARFNRARSKTKSPVDMAIAIGKQDTSRLVGQILSTIGEVEKLSELYQNQNTIAAIMKQIVESGIINQNEMPQFYTQEYGITDAGKDFIETLLVGSVINEDQIRILNSEGMKQYREKIVSAMLPIANNMKYEDNIGKHLNTAIKYLKEARDAKTDLRGILLDVPMFDAKEYEDLSIFTALMLQRKPTEFREFINNLNQRLELGTDNLFGESNSAQSVLEDYKQQNKLTDNERETIRLAEQARESATQGVSGSVQTDGTDTDTRGKGDNGDSIPETGTTKTEVGNGSYEQGEDEGTSGNRVAESDGGANRRAGEFAKEIFGQNTESIGTSRDNTGGVVRKLLGGENDGNVQKDGKTNKEEILTRITELGKLLNTPINIYHSEEEAIAAGRDDIIEDEKAGLTPMGGYNPYTGEVSVYLPNINSIENAEKVILHEVVAHKGIGYLLGDNLNPVLDAVWRGMPDDERKHFGIYALYTLHDGYRDLSNEDKRRIYYESINNKDVTRLAAEEYIANIAEKTDFTDAEKTVWQNVVNAITRLINRLYATTFTDREIDTLLRASYSKLAQIPSDNSDIRYRSTKPFYSNAEITVQGVKQEKATPEQWLAMLTKNGGLKASEDRWLGLSDWLKAQKGSVTKQDILDYINANKIEIEEVNYSENPTGNEREVASIRLDYTTEGIENKKEIALVVPNIESYEDWDTTHFGDAGDGRAIAWVRFGDIVDFMSVEDTQVVDEFHEPYKNFRGFDVYKPIGSFKDGDYIIHGKLKNGEYAYVVYINDSEIKVAHNTLEDARNAMNEYYKEHPRLLKQPYNTLVIDEIQSKRHQDAREKGYVSDYNTSETLNKLNTDLEDRLSKRGELIRERAKSLDGEKVEIERMRFALDKVKNIKEYDSYNSMIEEIESRISKRDDEIKSLSKEIENLEHEISREEGRLEYKKSDAVPNAPFEKNWHELAMKRMLRYAAENGYSQIAWTTGATQTERYSLANEVNSIEAEDNAVENFRDGTPIAKTIHLDMDYGESIRLNVDSEGKIRGGKFDGNTLSNVVGKDLAARLMEKGHHQLYGDGLTIGGEGMKGFYDKMLVDFMNKYGKKWGVKVNTDMVVIDEDNIQEMHTIDVTDAMVRSVMEGQPMFRVKSERQESIKSRQRAENIMRNAIDPMARELGVEVNYVTNESISDVEPGARKKRQSKGWYQDGKVYINLSTQETIDDARETYLHEVVGHYGLRGLLKDQFEPVMQKVFASLTPTQQQSLLEIFADEVEAAEEFLSSMAENDIDPTLLEKILGFIRDALRSMGINLDNYTDGDLQYLLWRSKNSLKENAGAVETARWEAKDAEVRYRTVGRPANYLTNDLEMTAKDKFLHKIQDRMRPVTRLTREIEQRGGRINEASDVHSQEFLSASRASAEMEDFNFNKLIPLVDSFAQAMKVFTEKMGMVREDAEKAVYDYLYAMHAPERNKRICMDEMLYDATQGVAPDKTKLMDTDFMEALEIVAGMVYDNQFNNGRNIINPYSNLSREQNKLLISLAGKLQKEAVMISKHFGKDALGNDVYVGNNRSGMHDTEAKALLNRLYNNDTKAVLDAVSASVKECTDFTLNKWLEYDLISKAEYDAYKSQYKYYIPLRGWEEKGDNTDYTAILNQRKNSGGLLNLNRQAKGRWSKADNPIAYIQSMAQSACITGNRNLIRRKAFNLVMQNSNMKDLMSFEYTYEVYDNDGNLDYTTVIRPDQSLFDEGKVKAVLDKTYEWHKTPVEYDTHVVPVMINGTRHNVVFKGTLGGQVATAINGNENKTTNILKETFAKGTRWISSNLTAKDIYFLTKNVVRDLGFGNFAYFVENGKMINPAIYASAMKTAAMDAMHADASSIKDYDLYQEFKLNGGQTGYVQLAEIDKLRKDFEKMVKEATVENGFLVRNGKDMANTLVETFDVLGKASENAMRFAVYKTERQKGASPREAAIRAKEITVNFNRQGVNTKGLSATFAFFNPAVQGTYRYAKLFKEHPGRFIAATAGLMAMKFGLGVICQMFSGGDDEPAGESAYDRLSDYVKATNWVVPLSWLPGDEYKDQFLCIPLPQSVRASTYLSDCAVDMVFGKKDFGEAMKDFALFGVGEFLPFDIDAIDLSGDNPVGTIMQAFSPTLIRPFTEIIINRDFMGNPISKEPLLRGKDNKPQSDMAFATTSPILVGASEFLNKIAGGDELRTAGLQISQNGQVVESALGSFMDVNPARIEHLFSGYFGGMFKPVIDTWTTMVSVTDEDMELTAKSAVLVNQFLKGPTSKPGYKTYYNMRDEYDNITYVISTYKDKPESEEYQAVISNKYNHEIMAYYKTYSDIVKSFNESIALIKTNSGAVENYREKLKELEAQRDTLILKAATAYRDICERRDNDN